MRINRMIAPKPTKKERIPRMTGRKRYKPTKAQINPVPHREQPKTTATIFTTNLMLIGRLLPCFLFFTILLIISDFFFMPYRSRWGVTVFQGHGKVVFSRCQIFCGKYTHQKGKRKIFHKTVRLEFASALRTRKYFRTWMRLLWTDFRIHRLRGRNFRREVQ